MKKILLFLLVTLLAFSTLAAEGNAESAENEVVEMKWYFNDGGAQVTDEWFVIKQIEEELGIKLTHVSPGGSDYLTRLQLMLASQDVPQLINSYTELSSNLVKWGVVAPINKYIVDEADKYVPNLVKNMNNWDLGVQLMTYPNGNIYGIPATNSSSRTTTQWIRMDWLDNLGLEVPTTQDELLDVLRAFTYDDPDGNGKDDTLGTMMNEHWAARVYAVAFAATVDNYYPNGDELILGQYSPNHKDYLAFLAQLVEEGLVDPEIPTLRNNEVGEKLAGGKFGYFWGWNNVNVEQKMHEVNPDAVWEPMAPWVGTVYDVGYNDAGGILREETLITVQESEEDYAKIFELVEWLIDDKSTDAANPSYEGTYWTAGYGEKGVWWDVRDDGLIELGQWGDDASNVIKANKEGYKSGAMKRFRSKFDMAWLLAQPARAAKQFVFMDKQKTINDIPADDPNYLLRRDFVTPMLPVELSEKLGTFVSDQERLWETMFYSIVLGTVDIDDAWSDWIAQAEAAGLREIMTEVSAAAKAGGLY